MLKLILFIIAFCFCAAAAVALSLCKKNANPREEVLWGKRYRRRVQMCRGEVQQLSISQSGNGYISTLIPVIKGTANLQLSPELLDTFAKKIEKQDEGNSVPTKILLMLMQIDEKSYVVQIPKGKKVFLGEATILSDKKSKDEYDFKELMSVEDKIKPILYNRNALLICSVVCLLIGHSFVSILLSGGSIYLSLQNRLFSPFTTDDTLWTQVDTSKYPQPSADKPEFKASCMMSAAEKKIQEVIENLPKNLPACKNCGALLEAENWQFCPHCGQPIEGTECLDSIPDDTEPDIPGDIPNDVAPIEDEDFPEDLIHDLNGMPIDEMPMGDMSQDGSLIDDDESFSPEEDSSDTFSPDEETEGDVEDTSSLDDGDIDFLNVDDLPEPEDFRGESPDGMIDADYRVLN